jgi:hypothetical protein
MGDLERKQRLLEIPRLVEIERAKLADIGEQMEKLEAERKERLQTVLELQREEVAILRAATAQP